MDISPLIKTGELIVDKYGKSDSTFLPSNCKQILIKNLEEGTSICYLSYLLDVYWKSLSYVTNNLRLKVTIDKNVLRCFYLY